MRERSFRTKLIFIFIAVAIIQGTLIGFYSHQYASQIVMNNKKSDMADLVNRIDINVNDKVRYMTKQLENAVTTKMFRNYFDTKDASIFENMYFAEYLDHIASPLSSVTNVILMDDSKVIYDRNGEVYNDSAKNRLHNIYSLASQKRGQAVWLGIVEQLSDKTMFRQKPKQVISVASAIVNPSTKKVDGVLLIELDPVNFSSLLLNNQNTFANQYTFIIDKKWATVCSNKTIDDAWVDLIAAEFDKGNRKFEMKWQGNEYFVCGQYNGVTGWETFSVIAKNNIFTQTEELLKLIMAFVMFCTLGVSMIITAVTYTMTKPLEKLSDAMKKTQEGDFSQQVYTKRHDEIGRLICSFNYMVKKINSLINEVYKEKIAQKNAEIKALQSQINPHFLYNTLDSINWMVIDKGAYEISDVIIALGDLMKYTMDQQNSMVPLEREMKYVFSYLRIQENRLEEKLQYEILMPNSVKNRLVPKLILQPIIENAITHGIEPLKKGGVIKIEVKELDKKIYIEISDNGKGMEKAELSRILHHLDFDDDGYTNIGVKNVDKRIRLHFGDEYRIKIESELDKGTKITICIPQEEREE